MIPWKYKLYLKHEVSTSLGTYTFHNSLGCHLVGAILATSQEVWQSEWVPESYTHVFYSGEQ